MTERKRGLFGLFKKNEAAATQVSPQGPATQEQREMRLRMAEFETARVADVMIPRAEIIGVEVNTSFDDLIQFYASEAHSRLPVYRSAKNR
jgi:CBS domain containing-hemolysin-like protein